MTESSLNIKIQQLAEEYITGSGVRYKTVSTKKLQDLAAQEGASLRCLQQIALELEIVPKCYVRNFKTLSFISQTRLLQSKVAMFGLGGLGGYLLEHLLRAGVGQITACDGDWFDESNLNRQLLASHLTQKKSKAQAALERAETINPACELKIIHLEAEKSDMLSFTQGADLVIDALGGLKHRLVLQQVAADNQVPLVTAAVSGWLAFVSTILPGHPGPWKMMGAGGDSAEETQGTIVSAVNMAACLQSAEAIRLLSREKSRLAGKILFADLAEMDFQLLDLS